MNTLSEEEPLITVTTIEVQRGCPEDVVFNTPRTSEAVETCKVFGMLMIVVFLLGAGVTALTLPWLLPRDGPPLPFSPPGPPRRTSFYGADNVTGFSSYVVPNIVHYVRFSQRHVSFWDAVALRSAYINHGPDEMWIHCEPCGLHGRYADWVSDIPVLKFVRRKNPKEVFGRKFHNLYHVSDVTRVQVLLQYGGIYLDNDVIVIQPLHRFRYYEMAIGWPSRGHIGNQVQIASPGARFLRLYQELYKEYNGSLWYYNGGYLPTERLLWPHPHLVHAVSRRFGVGLEILGLAYTPGKFANWPTYYTVHAFRQHRHCELDPLYHTKINEHNVRTYNTSMGEMMRQVLFGTTDFVSDDTPVVPVRQLFAARRASERQPRASP